MVSYSLINIKTTLIPIIILIWTQTSFSQETINFKDSLGRKQGYWVYCGSDRPDSGVPANGKVEEGYYLNDRKQDYWIKYHDNGETPRLIGQYENNRPKGNYTKYWPNGQLKEFGTFVKNQSFDSLKRFSECGNLEFEAWFNENGKEHGRVNDFYENGQLERTYFAVNGLCVDTAFLYYHNGDMKEIIIYGKNGEVVDSKQMEPTHPLEPMTIVKNTDSLAPDISKNLGLLHKEKRSTGFYQIYADNGKIWLDGTFKKGILQEGKQYVYDRNGFLLRVKIYKEGKHVYDVQF